MATAYDRWAPIYDLVFGNVFKSGRQQSIEAAEAVGGRILEVGVGTGISLPQYRRENRIVGIDISDAMLDKARERVRRFDLRNVEDIRVMDAERLDFDDNSFDVLVAQYVVTAVPDPERALDEFVRVVRPGGEIVIATRIGAGAGMRGTVEKALMPITSKLGWRTEFPWSRYEAWAASNGRVRLVENRPLPPLGHFSMVRYAKLPG
ncbi:class I SAM-dependent methyltransferase [Novosphingobium marinum]|uniref:Phosphatidylethanolamine/phosphatidyl-N-methylethanolamine N-methyltransferase n=1 Tax=Novosphingobium marinum TaxID=1514948 RepID=A0A7Y9XV39_9SPHN|nr:class I SAM-dependent methyltransferase [Novosphingobium marinum]NYH95042.1 phosphatidylethanolamine/phosphatidyl-N-methylethanolamine N-methyltransferase [Novosphingobium marinum]